MVDVPVETGVTTPELLIVATEVELLLQVPPPTVDPNPELVPKQKVSAPVIVAVGAVTVTTRVAIQPAEVT